MQRRAHLLQETKWFENGIMLVIVLTATVRPFSNDAQQENLLQSLEMASLLAIFLTLWWAAGATVMTFFGPFTATSNPYISCWAALICCIFMLIDTINPHLTDDAEEATGIASGRGSKRAYAGLFFASLVMIGSSAALQARNWELVLSIACCGVTLLIVFLLILDGAQLNEPLFSYRLRALLVLVLMLLWILVVWFATFSGPFNVTGETT